MAFELPEYWLIVGMDTFASDFGEEVKAFMDEFRLVWVLAVVGIACNDEIDQCSSPKAQVWLDSKTPAYVETFVVLSSQGIGLGLLNGKSMPLILVLLTYGLVARAVESRQVVHVVSVF